jgi:hypothetical protein
MKLKIRIVMIIGLAFGLTSCIKENKYPIVGTWGELKLRTYQQSYAGVISGDTSYVGPAFSQDDHAQFNNDGTGSIQLYHHYYPSTLEGLAAAGNTATTNIKYNFTVVGGKYVLNAQSPFNSPGGFATTDTVSFVDGGGMLIHSTFDNHQFYIISDAYYAKQGHQPL